MKDIWKKILICYMIIIDYNTNELKEIHIDAYFCFITLCFYDTSICVDYQI